MATINSKTNALAAPSSSNDNTTPAAATPTITGDQTPTASSVDMGPVQAYAKLEGQHYCYYIRTLQVTLGRKVNRPGKTDKVDIPLGNTKSVSRQHARLFYNFTTQRFEMMVIGKNGAFVNDQFIERGITIPLENRTKITIGQTNFIFLLPYMDSDDGNISRNDTTNYTSSSQHSEKQRKRKAPQQDNSSIANISSPMDDDEGEPVDEDFKKTMIGYPGVPNPYLGKEDKPPFSYANLIAQAINNASTDKRMTLNEIYTYLSTAYPYFKKVSSTGWQNSVRHNLSLNKAFIKMPRSNNDSGKGAFWTIDPKLEYSIFATNVPIKQRNSKRSSGLSSPATSSKDGDDDNSSTNIVTTNGPPVKKPRKEKGTKDTDDTTKGKKQENTKDTNTSKKSSIAESAPSSTTSSPPPLSPISSQSLQQAIVSSNELKGRATSPETTLLNSQDSTNPIQSPSSIVHDDNKGTTKQKQRKSSKSKITTPATSSHSANNISSMAASASSPSSSLPPPLPLPQSALTPSTSTSTSSTTTTTDNSATTQPTQNTTTVAKPNTNVNNTAANVQAQLQLQLQNTIRQHLLDPIRNPLPPTIAQLLPQAIAQLPPQIANQLSSTLNVALRAQQQHHLQQQRQQQEQQQKQQQQDDSAPKETTPTSSTNTTAPTTSTENPSSTSDTTPTTTTDTVTAEKHPESEGDNKTTDPSTSAAS